MTITRTMTISLEIEVNVEADYDKGYPEKWYMPNGDPGYPGQPETIAIYKVESNGVDITSIIPEKDIRWMEEELLNGVSDDDFKTFED